MKIAHFIGSLALLSSLTACTGGAVPLGSADGDYTGTATRFQALRRNCPRPRIHSAMQVRGGVLFYPWENQYIQASVLSSGTVTGSLQNTQLTGTYNGTVIQATVTDGQCGLHFTLKRAGT